MKILNHKIEEELTATEVALDVVKSILTRAKMRPSFSNAGEVDVLPATTKLNCQSRVTYTLLANQPEVNPPLEPDDFDPHYKRIDNPNDTCGEDLKGNIAQDIIDELESIQLLARSLRARGEDPRRGYLYGRKLKSFITQTRESILPAAQHFHSFGLFPTWHNTRHIESLAKVMAADVYKASKSQDPQPAFIKLDWDQVVKSPTPMFADFVRRHTANSFVGAGPGGHKVVT